MLKNATQIKHSPKKMDVGSIMVDVAPKLNEPDSLKPHNRVTVNMKMVELKEEMQIGCKMKRVVIIPSWT